MLRNISQSTESVKLMADQRCAGKNRTVRIVMICLLMTVTAAGCYFAVRTYRELKPAIIAENYYKKIRDKVADKVTREPDAGKLKEWNRDGIAWLSGPGTPIDYPVVQGKDNDYYLHHLSDGTPNEIGAIFLDYRNKADFSGDISVIYGHHITLNRMFSPLSQYKEQSYYDQYPDMVLDTPDQTYKIELFAGTILNGENESFPIEFKRNKEKKEWIRKRMEESTFQSKVKPFAKDRIVVLCTCSYEFYNARYAVYGRLIEMER